VKKQNSHRRLSVRPFENMAVSIRATGTAHVTLGPNRPPYPYTNSDRWGLDTRGFGQLLLPTLEAH